MNQQHVILVDAEDNAIGTMEKIKAHQLGICHRAFSVFIFDKKKCLIQKRAAGKYHCGGLWTNTCCSHPYPNEDIITAGERRLNEELGLSLKLKHIGEFHYIAHFENGLTENEYDHVLVGFYQDETIAPNKNEIAEIKWIDVDTLQQQLKNHPEQFTPWFEPALKIALSAHCH